MKRPGIVTDSQLFYSAHTFHIPVMGTGFTIDTPLRVAKYGISSAISLVDDVLIEQIRKFHCERENEPYEEITNRGEDARARRITAYLDLVNCLVSRQVRELQASPFEEGSEITRYYKMLPETHLKRIYYDMLATADPAEKVRLQEMLRRHAVPGNINVNIMTKLDRDVYRNGRKLSPEHSDAISALRGYGNSALRSSIIFSAGMNQRLYGYIAKLDDFFHDENCVLKKKIVLKVSDYRSAIVQGKYLAKRGLWVSEYRIESGLNCGGHTFATAGHLMGPILEEFKQKKTELIEKLHAIYTRALAAMGRSRNEEPHDLRITVQGGIGTASENEFLLKYFEVDGTGWGTPFLLVPEVTNVDELHLRKLSTAEDRDVYPSDSSPLGIPFWNLRSSASEEARRQRIKDGRPGSRCPKGYLVSNTEFTKIPICHASYAYQRLKRKQLLEENLPAKKRSALEGNVLGKSCICHDLAGGAALKTGIDKDATPAVCCGPNIVNFSMMAALDEMVSHIYGRISLLTRSDRPHMFIRELTLYLDYLRREIERISLDLCTRTPKYIREFKENLLSGIEYYRGLAEKFVEEKQKRFLDDLRDLSEEIERIQLLPAVEVCAEIGS